MMHLAHFPSGCSPVQCALGWFCLSNSFQPNPVCDSVNRMAPAPEPWTYSDQQIKPAKENEGFFLTVWFLVACRGREPLTLSALGVPMKMWLKPAFYYFLNAYIHATVILSGFRNLCSLHSTPCLQLRLLWQLCLLQRNILPETNINF